MKASGASLDPSGQSMLISNAATAQGFTIIEAVLDGTELARTLETSDLDRSRAGARHLMNHPAVSAVAVDPRMVAIAGRFLGETAIPYEATLFDKSPARNWLVAWHQDTALPLCECCEIPEWGPWSIKAGVTYAHAPVSALAQVVALRLHLDDSRPDNGPLRVLPGTHTLGVLTESDIARLTTEVTGDVERRLHWHNTGPSGVTVHHRPWFLVVSLEFTNVTTAARFERYLKTGSGRAFARRHFGEG